MAKSILNEWLRKYEMSGIEGVKNGKNWKQYSAELKIEAVEDVVIRGMS